MFRDMSRERKKRLVGALCLLAQKVFALFMLYSSFFFELKHADNVAALFVIVCIGLYVLCTKKNLFAYL